MRRNFDNLSYSGFWREPLKSFGFYGQELEEFLWISLQSEGMTTIHFFFILNEILRNINQYKLRKFILKSKIINSFILIIYPYVAKEVALKNIFEHTWIFIEILYKRNSRLLLCNNLYSFKFFLIFNEYHDTIYEWNISIPESHNWLHIRNMYIYARMLHTDEYPIDFRVSKR